MKIPQTASTTDLDNWLNRQLILNLEVLENPKM